MGLRALGALVVCSLFACGGASSGGDADANRDGAADGDGSDAWSNWGTDGADGTGGAPGNCQDCIACVQGQCAMDVTTCEGDMSCRAIWQCAMACTLHLDACVQANNTGYFWWAPTVGACAKRSCASSGCPY